MNKGCKQQHWALIEVLEKIKMGAYKLKINQLRQKTKQTKFNN